MNNEMGKTDANQVILLKACCPIPNNSIENRKEASIANKNMVIINKYSLDYEMETHFVEFYFKSIFKLCCLVW